jgi:hypothetical protein
MHKIKYISTFGKLSYITPDFFKSSSPRVRGNPNPEHISVIKEQHVAIIAIASVLHIFHYYRLDTKTNTNIKLHNKVSALNFAN